MIALEQSAGVVAVDERFVVDVVHDEIERAIAIQVRVHCAVAEAGLVQSPAGGLVRKGQITLVAEGVVLELSRGHRVDEGLEIDFLPLGRRPHRLLAREEGDVILRRHVLGKAVRDIDVLEAIQIEIREERAPAPVGPGHSSHLPNVAERSIAVVQL